LEDGDDNGITIDSLYDLTPLGKEETQRIKKRRRAELARFIALQKEYDAHIKRSEQEMEEKKKGESFRRMDSWPLFWDDLPPDFEPL